MRPILNWLSVISPVFFLPIYIIARKKRKMAFGILILTAVCFSSCFLHYYKTNTSKQVDAATIQKLIDGKKYFILHTSNQNFALINIKAANDILEGDVDTLPEEHSKYLQPKKQNANAFPRADKEIVLYEVHLYTNDSANYNSHIRLPFKDFYELHVYEVDTKATTRSTILSTIGITLTTAGIVILIIGLSSQPSHQSTTTSGDSIHCSPKVYVLNRDKSELTGILYSGAIFAPLERTDYMPLPAIPSADAKLHLQIKGEKNEELLINEIKLLQVTHKATDKALVDRYGKMFVYHELVAPERAVIGASEEITRDVTAIDEKYYSFTNHLPGQNISDVILDFKKPVTAHSCKLIIRAKNSIWSHYLFNKFKSLYGENYTALVQQKDKADPKKLMQCELDQSLPLLVYVKDGNNWKFADCFLTSGNDVPRDMIMELNLEDFRNMNHMQIRLATTYMFWDLDYAGMDFSENIPYTTTYQPADKILKSDNISQLDALDQKDKIYAHISDKEKMDIEFNLKQDAKPDFASTYFLVGSGYYHDNTRFEGKPQLIQLSTFAGKGAFDKFSRQKFDELLSMLNSSSGKDLVSNK